MLSSCGGSADPTRLKFAGPSAHGVSEHLYLILWPSLLRFFFAKWAGPGGPGIRKPRRRRRANESNCILSTPRRSKDALFFSSFLRCILGSISVRFSLPTCFPKSTKIHQKSMPRCLPMLTSFFDCFLMGFCFQLRPLEPQESSPRCSESTIYQKIAFRMLH